jgi:uncharacterized protein
MSTFAILAILAATLVTAAISGVFGMAGGLILMGVLLALTPVATAMVLHGAIQIVSNFSRAALHVRHVSWPLVGRYAAGSALAGLALLLLSWRPSETVVLILLGLTPLAVWAPKRALDLDVSRPLQAEVCGFLVQSLNTLAGVAGPLLDVFFARTDLPRHRVVATKAATQVLAHAVKIGFWAGPFLAYFRGEGPGEAAPPAWLFLAVVPLSLTGTWLGSKALERMTNDRFRMWTRWIVTAMGAVYLAQGLSRLAG